MLTEVRLVAVTILVSAFAYLVLIAQLTGSGPSDAVANPTTGGGTTGSVSGEALTW